MAERDERELKARIDAADAKAPKCEKGGHALRGWNIYRGRYGDPHCYLCRLEHYRQTKRAKPPSRRKPRTPLNPAYIAQLRLAAGVTVDDQANKDTGAKRVS